MAHNISLVKIAADFKAHHYQIALKLQKSCEPSKTTSLGNRSEAELNEVNYF